MREIDILRYRQVKKLYTTEFFYGDPYAWDKKREQPFADLKHIFRQEIHDKYNISYSEHARLEGVGRHTIRHSVLKDTFKIHEKLVEQARQFIKDKLTVSVPEEIRSGLMDFVNQGYSNKDIAKLLGVHESVIQKSLIMMPISDNTLNYLHLQLYASL